MGRTATRHSQVQIGKHYLVSIQPLRSTVWRNQHNSHQIYVVQGVQCPAVFPMTIPFFGCRAAHIFAHPLSFLSCSATCIDAHSFPHCLSFLSCSAGCTAQAIHARTLCFLPLSIQTT